MDTNNARGAGGSWRLPPLAVLVMSMAACGGGGGGGGGSGSGSGGTGGSTWMPGVFQPSSSFANRCTAPRSGTDPYTGQPYPDLTGTLKDENNFLRSWTNELYLWYSEVSDLDPALYLTADYFDRLKTNLSSPTGAPKDKFHFTYPTAAWEALASSGDEVSYGLSWALTSTTPPRHALVAYVEPSPPPATINAAMARGDEVLTVDDVSIDVNTSIGVATLNAGLYPESAGESHTFTVRDVAGTTRTVTLVSQTFTSSPVQNVHTIGTASGTVGYLQFNDHLAPAEGALIDAINALEGVQDLVLDIRYNGGGFLDIASELAYMIAGPAATAGQTFELQQFNSKYTTTNPVTGQALTPTLFHSTTQGFTAGLAAGQPLPTLNLPRVYVLTGGTTCSASEAIINGLRGVGVTVIQIGSVTCGKPYGFYPRDNCGTTYFSIEFRGVNAQGYGDYTDGFFPANSTTVGDAQATVAGCSVADDFSHALGDPAEGRLAAALYYQTASSCSGPATGTVKALAASEGTVRDVIVPKSPWRENRILRP